MPLQCAILYVLMPACQCQRTRAGFEVDFVAIRRQLSAAGLDAEGATAQVSAPAPGKFGADDDPVTYLVFVHHIIREYTLVVTHGRKRVFHALPRLLTALIEHGGDVARISEAAAGKRSADPTAAAMLHRLNKQATREQAHVRVRPVAYSAGFAAPRSYQWLVLPQEKKSS